jgi:hypothetical protein
VLTAPSTARPGSPPPCTLLAVAGLYLKQKFRIKTTSSFFFFFEKN